MGAFTVTSKTDAIVTITPGLGNWSGAYRAVRVTLGGPASYDTGGSSLPDLGLREVILALPVQPASGTNNLDTNFLFISGGVGKLKLRQSTDATEVAAATDKSTRVFDVLVIGR